MRTLGDVMDPSLRRTVRQWNHLGRARWIVKPDWIPPVIPGMEPAGRLIDEHVMPRLWQLLADNFELLKSGVFRTQPPGWLEPPFTAQPEDLATEVGVALSNGSPVVVLEYHVPDRHVASFPRFGQMLDHAAEWGTVLWTIQVNGKPVRTYHNFRQQRGTFIEPTLMAKPLTLKSKDHLEVIATGGANVVSAFARMPGWVLAATSITQDGTAIDWNVR